MTVSIDITSEDLELMDNKRLHRVSITDPNGVVKTWTAYDEGRVKNSMNQKVQKLSRDLQQEKKLSKTLVEQINALEKQKDHDSQASDNSGKLFIAHQKLNKAEADIAALTNRLREAQEAQKSSDLKALEAQRKLQQQTTTLAEARTRIKALEKEQKEKDTAHKHQLADLRGKLAAHKKSSDTETQQQSKTLAEARARIKTLEKEQKEKDTAHKHKLADLRGDLLASEEDLKESQAQSANLCKERDSLQQSRNDLSKQAKLDKDEFLMKIKELEDLIHLQRQSEQTAKATESKLRESLQVEHRNSSDWQLKAIEHESTIVNLTAIISDLQTQDQERQLMLVEDTDSEPQMVNENCQTSKQTDHEEIAALQDVNSKQTPQQRTPRVCSASEPSTSEWGYESEPDETQIAPTKMAPQHSKPPRKATSKQDFVDPHRLKKLLAMEKAVKNLDQENQQLREKIKKKELAKAAKRSEADSIKNC